MTPAEIRAELLARRAQLAETELPAVRYKLGELRALESIIEARIEEIDRCLARLGDVEGPAPPYERRERRDIRALVRSILEASAVPMTAEDVARLLPGVRRKQIAAIMATIEPGERKAAE